MLEQDGSGGEVAAEVRGNDKHKDKDQAQVDAEGDGVTPDTSCRKCNREARVRETLCSECLLTSYAQEIARLKQKGRPMLSDIIWNNEERERLARAAVKCPECKRNAAKFKGVDGLQAPCKECSRVADLLDEAYQAGYSEGAYDYGDQ